MQSPSRPLPSEIGDFCLTSVTAFEMALTSSILLSDPQCFSGNTFVITTGGLLYVAASITILPRLQEKRSAYAPTEEQPVRYDGVYRIVRAYRKPGNQKFLVCRYLFMRCDNAAAPWSSEGELLTTSLRDLTMRPVSLPSLLMSSLSWW